MKRSKPSNLVVVVVPCCDILPYFTARASYRHLPRAADFRSMVRFDRDVEHSGQQKGIQGIVTPLFSTTPWGTRRDVKMEGVRDFYWTIYLLTLLMDPAAEDHHSVV